jgi:hypothetical protein
MDFREKIGLKEATREQKPVAREAPNPCRKVKFP